MLNAIKPSEEKKADNKDLEVVEVKNEEHQEEKNTNPKLSPPEAQEEVPPPPLSD